MKYGAIGFGAFLLAPGLLEGGHWLLHILAVGTVIWCAWRGGMFADKEKAPRGSGVPAKRRRKYINTNVSEEEAGVKHVR